eukprot:TRINITY_DN11056_c0_g1_i1.p1 TRINITY_DN11056_c0_g1~~TRINITY_DN11056_c0_g1_i1.p1  ORF type:complete len:553 (+),score=74.38 TRINITY_DN11056_c0_g1_i1:306-1964(+)
MGLPSIEAVTPSYLSRISPLPCGPSSRSHGSAPTYPSDQTQGSYKAHTYSSSTWGTLIAGGHDVSSASIFYLYLPYSDVTVEQQAQVELCKARDVAIQLARAKSDFLANMSHEIRTPLNAVVGISECLTSGMMGSLEFKDAFSILQSSSVALMSIVNQILDYSKYEAGKIDLQNEPFVLASVFTDVAQSFTIHARTKREVSFEYRVNDPRLSQTTVMGDPGRLRQVASNLVSNAMKFTAAGMVSLTLDSLPEKESGHVNVVLTVRDTGIGMSPQTLSKLFTPFTQADASITREYGGTGLGLAISRQIIECMGGTIDVSSEVGQGSLFRVYMSFAVASQAALLLSPSLNLARLQMPTTATGNGPPSIGPSQSDKMVITKSLLRPQTPPTSLQNIERTCVEDLLAQDIDIFDAPAAKTTLHPLPCPICSHIYCLVAEDNPVNCKIISMQLGKLGVQYAMVNNGSEAVQAVSNDILDKYNMILMDIQMPVMDGYTAARVIRESHPHKRFPIIALSANVLAEHRKRGLDSDMDDYITKPLQLSALVAIFHKWGVIA